MTPEPFVVAGLDAKRVGIVTPPANPTVEPETRALLPRDVATYATRLPIYPGDLQARTARYAEGYGPALASFGTLELHAAYIGMTGASYALRLEGDRALCDRLARDAGVRVWTASLAIHDALAALDVREIVLVSPYPQWLTDRAVDYWDSAGIRVVQVVRFGEEFRAYQLTDDEVADRLAEVRPPAGSAVVMSGTGMMALRMIAATRDRIPVPVLSSNLCGSWRLMQAIGAPATPALERVSPSLARTLSGGPD